MCMRWYRIWHSIDVFFSKAATRFAITFLLIGVLIGAVLGVIIKL